MDTRKFEYLETIREAIEMGDYDELDEYVEDIRERVKTDPDFIELFGEIKSRKYMDALSLIDEFIYEDIESEFGSSFDERSLTHINGTTVEKKKGIAIEMDEEPPEEITFEEFNDEDFTAGSGYEDD